MQFIHKINTQLWMVATMEDHRLRSHLPNKPNIWVHQMILSYLQNFPHVMIRYYPASAKSNLVFTLSRFPLNLAMRMYVCFRMNGILQVIHLTSHSGESAKVIKISRGRRHFLVYFLYEWCYHFCQVIKSWMFWLFLWKSLLYGFDINFICGSNLAQFKYLPQIFLGQFSMTPFVRKRILVLLPYSLKLDYFWYAYN